MNFKGDYYDMVTTSTRKPTGCPAKVESCLDCPYTDCIYDIWLSKEDLQKKAKLDLTKRIL